MNTVIQEIFLDTNKKDNYFGSPGCMSVNEHTADAQRHINPNIPLQTQTV